MTSLTEMSLADILPDSFVTAENQEQFAQKGYFVLERVIPPAHLELLQAECEQLMQAMDAKMEAAGADHMGLNFHRSRYFLSAWHHSEAIKEFVFSDVMAAMFFPQYTAEPILKADGSGPIHLAEPFLVDDVRVAGV